MIKLKSFKSSLNYKIIQKKKILFLRCLVTFYQAITILQTIFLKITLTVITVMVLILISMTYLVQGHLVQLNKHKMTQFWHKINLHKINQIIQCYKRHLKILNSLPLRRQQLCLKSINFRIRSQNNLHSNSKIYLEIFKDKTHMILIKCQCPEGSHLKLTKISLI